MKQIIQDLKSGETILEEVPAPVVRRGAVLIRTHRSLVSLGTERMLVEFGKASYLEKARQQPEKVKQVLDKIKSDGLIPTLEAVFRKLGEPLPLGYCNAGEVIAIGQGVSDFKIGDRVVSNGHHAEVVCINQNLVAKIPDHVTYDEAAFTVIGAIGLQGIRLINPTFGETIVVTGLGLIGLITSQLLLANGCRVIGLDFDQSKVELARSFGIEAYNVSDGRSPVTLIESLTDYIGADGVLITASTKSNDVIAQSAGMCRKKGRIVLVGVVGLDINRSDFFKKELSFQVSCSYGPGRYDDNYEEKGHDYPIGYVRWTEKRNFEAVLNALARKKLEVLPLITERIHLDDYLQIYGNMSNPKSIASIITYDVKKSDTLNTQVVINGANFAGQKGVFGVIGAGNFTGSTVLPMLSKAGGKVKTIASSKGLSGTILAKKFNIAQSSTDYHSILRDDEIDIVIITTRHNAHARQVIESLEAGKHVFVEKPLALNIDELNAIDVVIGQTDKTVTVGFNRRFSPFSIDAKKQIGSSGIPINVVATMNAGFIPQDVWVQDMEVGGGRIIGEACHYIDLISFFTGSHVESVVMNAMGTNPAENTDNASILLKYTNGSTGTINYFSNGSKAYSKERIEIYAQNRTIVMDNFRKSYYYGFKASGLSKTQDKGHREQFRLLVDRIKNGGDPIIPYADLMNTSKAAIAAVESLKTGVWITI
ncbi:MAG TPA: bi-domain-containing oxidoreductase [Saprospiraceae bacterium]|jgi:predicted dehydrogenase/threonine dehydrogenase-like Zn-dependent dehydrogenase|nr:bi-domain-containing oxidoreductase [Saprospiraceae bacterium]HRP40795.1 bi-domain-containing oxidoreductase [Saprospiraceae bacterium]